MQGMPQTTDIEFVRINCAPLMAAMRDEANAWLHGICSIMRSIDATLQQVRQKLMVQHCAGLKLPSLSGISSHLQPPCLPAPPC